MCIERSVGRAWLLLLLLLLPLLLLLLLLFTAAAAAAAEAAETTAAADCCSAAEVRAIGSVTSWPVALTSAREGRLHFALRVSRSPGVASGPRDVSVCKCVSVGGRLYQTSL